MRFAGALPAKAFGAAFGGCKFRRRKNESERKDRHSDCFDKRFGHSHFLRHSWAMTNRLAALSFQEKQDRSPQFGQQRNFSMKTNGCTGVDIYLHPRFFTADAKLSRL
jgi:hypothetical protein